FQIRNLITQCDATMIIAVKRLFLIEGQESPAWHDTSFEIRDRFYPSVWNQIEGAMALQSSHPLFLLREEGLFLEGIFKYSFLPNISFLPPQLTDGAKEAIIAWVDSF